MTSLNHRRSGAGCSLRSWDPPYDRASPTAPPRSGRNAPESASFYRTLRKPAGCVDLTETLHVPRRNLPGHYKAGMYTAFTVA